MHAVMKKRLESRSDDEETASTFAQLDLPMHDLKVPLSQTFHPRVRLNQQ